MQSEATSWASEAIVSGEKWKQPAIDSIGFFIPLPGQVKSGYTKSSTLTLVSLTSRRKESLLRSLLNLVFGKVMVILRLYFLFYFIVCQVTRRFVAPVSDFMVGACEPEISFAQFEPFAGSATGVFEIRLVAKHVQNSIIGVFPYSGKGFFCDIAKRIISKELVGEDPAVPVDAGNVLAGPVSSGGHQEIKCMCCKRMLLLVHSCQEVRAVGVVANGKDFVDEVVCDEFISLIDYDIHRFTCLPGGRHVVGRLGGPSGSDKMVEADSADCIDNSFDVFDVLLCDSKTQSCFYSDSLAVFDTL
jgi:hypothetical protein